MPQSRARATWDSTLGSVGLMKNTRRAPVTIVALIVAVVATACGGGSGDHGALGEPAAAADADRTIEVTTEDPFSFTPEQIEVSVDETVLFRVTNKGKGMHEFVLGAQEGHQHGDDGDTTVHLGPGETKELAWTFTEAGTVGFACYVGGHNEAGMTGTITVSA